MQWCFFYRDKLNWVKLMTLKYLYNSLFRKNKFRVEDGLMVKSIDESFNDLCNALDTNRRLFYSRYGDGELLTMMGKDHRNYMYNKGLAEELRASLLIENSQYLIALPLNYPLDRYWCKGIYGRFPWETDMKTFLGGDDLLRSIIVGEKTFENPCVFQCITALRPEKMFDFLDKYVRPKKKMFIGGATKESAEKLYGPIDYYVQTPFKHAYEEIDSWWPLIEKHVHDVELIIPAVGSSSNVIAKRLWDMDVQVHLIDIGSIIDAVDGKVSRTWLRLRGHLVNKIVLPEFQERSLKKRCQYLLKDIRFFFRNQFI